MANTILLVFEGERTEVRIFNKIKQLFFQNEENTIIHASYNAEIYQLYKMIEDDLYLDIVELLRERSDKNKLNLSGINRDDISQIYLFFDYDNQATGATDEKIEKMLKLFNEETGNGKLFISYPMVESLWHHNKTSDSCYETCSVPVSVIKYKEIVGEKTSFKDPKKIDRSDWNFITLQTVKKTNCIINGFHEKPEYLIFQSFNQKMIFENQLSKFIPQKRIAVLSGIPLFIVDYFGEKLYETL